MAKKRPALKRVLGARSVAAVAYGEIGASLFIALGIVAFLAGGLLPWVLLGVGCIFFLVSLSYAEGVAAIPETGGGPMLVRRAFNDPAGFFTGWVLLLDYLVVIALAALFVPHYVGAAAGWESLEKEPWDGIIGVAVILCVAALRLARRSSLYRIAQLVAGLALLTQLVVIVVGFAFVFDPSDIGAGVELGTSPSWHDLFFALAVATLAYTGLETVANFAAETTEPGRSLPKSLFGAVGAVVVMAFLLGLVGVSVPDLGGSGRGAPLEAIVDAARGSISDTVADVLDGLRRRERGDRPRRGGDHLDLRRRTAHACARPPRDAAAPLCPAQLTHADRAGRDRLGRRPVERAAPRRRLRRPRAQLPREPLQLRRPACVLRRADGGAAAAPD